MRKSIASVVVASLLFAASCELSALADNIKTVEVRFKAGASSASYSDRVEGYDTVAYRLGANAGQTMTVRLRPSNSSAYFNVTPPGGLEAIYIGSTDGANVFSEVLPSNGNYVVEVYLMRNAARRDEVANFSIEFSILGEGPSQIGAGGAPRQDFADGNQGGPDYWVVAGVSVGDALNIRMQPSASADVVARLDNGAVVRNLGCQEHSGTRWCRVELTGDSDEQGWAAGRYLQEANGPPPPPDAVVPGTGYHATGEVDCSFRDNPQGTKCTFGVVRHGSGDASLDVTFPDGFVRKLEFRHGVVTAADGSETRSERDGDNTIVRVGGNETIVIPALVNEGD